MQRSAANRWAFVPTMLVALALTACDPNAQHHRVFMAPPPKPLLETASAPNQTRYTIPNQYRRVYRAPTPTPPPAPRPTPVAAAPVQPRFAAPPIEGSLMPARLNRGRWQVIVVHHSAAESGSPASIDRYHRRERGWENGLGYDFVIGNGTDYPDGKIFVGHRWSRQITGAHCKTAAGRFFGAWRPDNFFNEHGIGVCLVGNFQRTSPTPRQIASLTYLLNELTSMTGISRQQIYGHGQITGKTACPGRNLTSKLAGVRQKLSIARLEPDRTPMGVSPADLLARDWCELLAHARNQRRTLHQQHWAHSPLTSKSPKASWLDDDFAAILDMNGDRTVFRLDQPTEGQYITYADVVDLIDQITNPNLGPTAGGFRCDCNHANALSVAVP